ncbi:MAG: hypothetical protein KJO40_19545 [Deltaproteobacteria bacterium]|nr:hypothetical protein [Deltaproteobacteria bacterium]
MATPSEVFHSELSRLTAMVANEQHPEGRGEALWHQLGQFEDSARKIVMAADEHSEELATELEAAAAELFRARAALTKIATFDFPQGSDVDDMMSFAGRAAGDEE